MTTPDLTVYNRREVTVIHGGIPIDGFGDNDTITLSPEADSNQFIVGNDGKTAMSRGANFNRRLTLRLLQTSAANQLLSALHLAGRIGGSLMTDVVPTNVVDGSGTSKFFAAKSVIVAPPTVTFGETVGFREWVIYMVAVAGID